MLGPSAGENSILSSHHSHGHNGLQQPHGPGLHLTTSMSTSRARVEDTYESQNDQRLEQLHSKIRTLRGVTSDIHDDVERQNSMLDETSNRFNEFGNTLTQASDRAARAFGIGEGHLKSFRIAMLIVVVFITFWILTKLYHWWWPTPTVTV